MSLGTNAALVHELYGSLMSHGDVDAARRIVADDYVDHDVPGPFPDTREGLIDAVHAVRTAFPDVRPELFETIAQNDFAAARRFGLKPMLMHSPSWRVVGQPSRADHAGVS